MKTKDRKTMSSSLALDVLATSGTTLRDAKGHEVAADAAHLVKRGELITMTYHKGLLTLTETAKSLQHGSKGDTVRVFNTANNITLEGIVTGFRQVEISSL